MLYSYIKEILDAPIIEFQNNIIGKSVEGRNIHGFVFGHGPKKVSLIAGNHSDEPVGPLLLKKLVSYFSDLPKYHYLFRAYTWYIVPHGNPDGEALNKKWYTYEDQETDLAQYLKHVVRELPGDDIEFGFPIKGKVDSLRPENKVIYDFWKSANTSFDLHVSLHGMFASYGAWFLIDEKWIDRTILLRERCINTTKKLKYSLYDLDRKGEKGFKRISQGFCTRPDSKKMREHFLSLEDKITANKFHASSMESIRSISKDCLTLVSEMPLFLFPKEERKLQWPDTYLQKWANQFEDWKVQLKSGQITAEQCNEQAKKLGVKSMPWKHQIMLQWQLITAGLEDLD